MRLSKPKRVRDLVGKSPPDSISCRAVKTPSFRHVPAQPDRGAVGVPGRDVVGQDLSAEQLAGPARSEWNLDTDLRERGRDRCPPSLERDAAEAAAEKHAADFAFRQDRRGGSRHRVGLVVLPERFA
jgi:hypothetical protein